MKFMNRATEKLLTVFCSCTPSYSGFGKRTFSKMLLTLSLIAKCEKAPPFLVH